MCTQPGGRKKSPGVAVDLSVEREEKRWVENVSAARDGAPPRARLLSRRQPWLWERSLRVNRRPGEL